MPRRPGKVQSPRFVHLSLHNARDDLLGGVFHGDHVPPALLSEVPEAGVNRRRFAAAGGAGQQQQAGGLTQKPIQLRERRGRKAQFFEPARPRGVKQAQHDLFPADRGISRDPDIGAGVEVSPVNPAILGEGFLISLEPGQELDAAKDTLSNGRGQPVGGRHYTVQAEGDRGAVR